MDATSRKPQNTVPGRFPQLYKYKRRKVELVRTAQHVQKHVTGPPASLHRNKKQKNTHWRNHVTSLSLSRAVWNRVLAVPTVNLPQVLYSRGHATLLAWGWVKFCHNPASTLTETCISSPPPTPPSLSDSPTLRPTTNRLIHAEVQRDLNGASTVRKRE